MTSAPLEVAYVEIRSRIDANFGRDIRRAVDRAMSQVERDSNDAFNAVSRAADKASGNATAALDRIRARLARGVGDLEIDVDTRAAAERLDVLARDREVEVDVDVDTDAADVAIAGLATRLANLGNGGRGGGRQIETFGQLSFSLSKAAAAAGGLLAAITPLGAGLVGVAAGATAVTGAVGLASGALLSGGAAASSLGLAYGAGKVASLGLADAFKAQAKAQEELAETGEVSAATQAELNRTMKNLTPSARQLVRTIEDLGGAYDRVRRNTQEALFVGQARNIRDLDAAFRPLIDRTLTQAAETLNDAADGVTRFLTSADGVRTVTTLLDGLNASLEPVLDGLGGISEGLLTLFAGSTGEGQRMAEAFADAGDSFADFADRVTDSGQLADFLERSREAAGALVGVVGELGGVIGGVFGAGAERGVGLLQSFEANLSNLNDTIRSTAGQNALAGFFDSIAVTGRVVGDVLSVVEPILDSVGDALTDLAPKVDDLREALLPVAQIAGEQVANALDVAAGALGAVLPLVTETVEVFNALPGPVKDFAVAVGLAAAAMRVLGPAFTTAQAGVTGFVGNLKTAEGRMSALRGGAQAAAGAGGMLLLNDAMGQTNKTLGALEGAASGALSGAALGAFAGGPGIAIGAGVGAVTGALLSLTSGTDDAAEAAQRASQAYLQYAGTLDQVTGAATAASKQAVLQALSEKKVLPTLEKLGLSRREIASALTEDGAARRKLLPLLDKEQKAAEKNLQTVKEQNLSLLSGNEAERKKAAALIGTAKAQLDAVKAAREQIKTSIKATEETRKNAAATRDYAGALKGLPPEVKTRIRTEGLEATFDGVKNLVTQYDLTPRQVRTVIEASGAKVTANQIENLIRLSKEAARKRKIVFAVEVTGLNSAIGAIEGAIVAAGGRIKRRARGGPVEKGQPYIVGEKRPELFVPEVNGRIIPEVPEAARRALDAAASKIEVAVAQVVVPANSDVSSAIDGLNRTMNRIADLLTPSLQDLVARANTATTLAAGPTPALTRSGPSARAVSIPDTPGLTRIPSLPASLSTVGGFSAGGRVMVVQAPAPEVIVQTTQRVVNQDIKVEVLPGGDSITHAQQLGARLAAWSER